MPGVEPVLDEAPGLVAERLMEICSPMSRTISGFVFVNPMLPRIWFGRSWILSAWAGAGSQPSSATTARDGYAFASRIRRRSRVQSERRGMVFFLLGRLAPCRNAKRIQMSGREVDVIAESALGSGRTCMTEHERHSAAGPEEALTHVRYVR